MLIVAAVGALITRRMNAINIVLRINMPCEAEITDLQLISLGANQQILWLNIPVHNVLRMKVVDGLEQLINEELNAVSIQSIWLLFQNFQQISVHELED